MQVKVAEDFEIGVTNKSPEFLKMNPIGKVYYFYLFPFNRGNFDLSLNLLRI